MSDKPAKPRRRGADSVKTRRQKVVADTVRLIPDISSFEWGQIGNTQIRVKV